MPVRAERGMGGWEALTRAVGVRERVMAWTLGEGGGVSWGGGLGGKGNEERGGGRYKGGLPMESPREDEIVVYGEFVEAIVEVALVDEAAGFVDDDEGVDDPGRC